MRARGVILFETLWILTIFVWFILGVYIAVNRFWLRRLDQLQESRLKYEGERIEIRN